MEARRAAYPEPTNRNDAVPFSHILHLRSLSPRISGSVRQTLLVAVHRRINMLPPPLIAKHCKRVPPNTARGVIAAWTAFEAGRLEGTGRLIHIRDRPPFEIHGIRTICSPIGTHASTYRPSDALAFALS
jgi:hypothetical protein